MRNKIMKTSLILIVMNCFIFCASNMLSAQTPLLNEIKTSIHTKSWYRGCPECRDKFDPAYLEVKKGSKEWKELVSHHVGCLMEEHRESEAISLLNKAMETDTNDHLFFAQIGTCFLRMNDLYNAEKNYIKSNEIKLNRIASYHLAHIYFAKGAGIDDTKDEKSKNARMELLAKAEKELNTAIELYNDRKQIAHISPFALTTLNSLLAHIKRAQYEKETAYDIMKTLIMDVEAETNWPAKRKLFSLTELYFNYGQMLYSDGLKDEGLEFMNKAIDTAPTNSLKAIKKRLA